MPTKTWVVGEEVLAADFNTMVQKQVIATFPNAAGRSAALPAPTPGMQTWLDDAKRMEVWDGTRWRPPYPAALARQTVLTSSADNQETLVQMGAADYNEGGFTIAGGLVHVPITGLYQVNGWMGTANTADNQGVTGHLQLRIRRDSDNGVLAASITHYAGVWATSTLSAVGSIPAGNGVGLYVTYAGTSGPVYVDPAGGLGTPSKLAVTLLNPT